MSKLCFWKILTRTHSSILFRSVSLFLACIASVSVQFRSKEWESKTAWKMAQVKEWGGGGEERKETLADKPLNFENRPLGLSCLSSRTDIWYAVISCHDWPIKCLSFQKWTFKRRVCETKIIFWNAWMALMVKSQWIWTINAGQSSARQNGSPFSPRHKQLECSHKSI